MKRGALVQSKRSSAAASTDALPSTRLAAHGHSGWLFVEQAIEQLIALLHTVRHPGRDCSVTRLLRAEIDQRGDRGHPGLLCERHRDDRVLVWEAAAHRARVVRLGVYEPRRRLHLAEGACKAKLAPVLVAAPAPAVSAADA